MGEVFHYETTVRPEWIDYNGHMQDAFYGLIFSYAVDAMQDAVGFDEEYRNRTGCTIYLLEDHKHYLKEVMEGAQVSVETRVLDHDDKRFQLHLTMMVRGSVVAVCEFLALYVKQRPDDRETGYVFEIARFWAAWYSARLSWRTAGIGVPRDHSSMRYGIATVEPEPDRRRTTAERLS
jgi:acyl-CoA thioester hydrolase